MTNQTTEYAGFWVRVLAALIDTLIVVAITVPLLLALYGGAYIDAARSGAAAGAAQALISWVGPAVAVVMFWFYKQATPGKMVLSLRVVDAITGNAPTLGQCIGRYLGYFVSTIPLGLGLIWVAFDARKQGWHDKLAGTVVLRARRAG